jgi:hypothetical protein
MFRTRRWVGIAVSPHRSEFNVKTRLSVALAAAAVLLVAFAAVASAATTTGKIYKFSYTASSKTGKLTTINSKKVKKSFVITAETNCGVSFGQSGDQIPCKTLGKSKYHGKPVRVQTGKNDAGEKITTLVAVDLSR